MASLSVAHALPSRLIHPPTTRTDIPSITTFLKQSPLSSNSRFKNAITLQIRRRLFVALASNSNTPGGDLIQDKSDGNKSDDARGPPFLTILAGFLILFMICWVFGSIVMWLFGLIVKAPPSN